MMKIAFRRRIRKQYHSVMVDERCYAADLVRKNIVTPIIIAHIMILGKEQLYQSIVSRSDRVVLRQFHYTDGFGPILELDKF
ncbi:hypothetical protein HUJ04_006676 [Dendroctonus ponderosae]|nr:hypothetical protein HUJ04_006676 [Dendroctonus ponderosae]